MDVRMYEPTPVRAGLHPEPSRIPSLLFRVGFLPERAESVLLNDPVEPLWAGSNQPDMQPVSPHVHSDLGELPEPRIQWVHELHGLAMNGSEDIGRLKDESSGSLFSL